MMVIEIEATKRSLTDRERKKENSFHSLIEQNIFVLFPFFGETGEGKEKRKKPSRNDNI